MPSKCSSRVMPGTNPKTPTAKKITPNNKLNFLCISASIAHEPTRFHPREFLKRLQIFDEVRLFPIGQSKRKERVVVVDHVEQRREATIMKEPAFRVREQAF